MPILIQPQPGVSTLGPWIAWTATSDFIGPIPNDSNFTWDIRNAAEGELCSGNVPTFGQKARPIVPYQQTAGATTQPFIQTPAQGSQVTLSIQLHQGLNGPVIDSGAISAPWDPTGNIPAQIQADAGAGSGGLTPEEATQLQETHQQVTKAFANPAGVLTQLGVQDLVHIPELGRLAIQATAHPLTGQGTIDPPSVAGLPVAYGVTFQVGTVPSGIGKFPGFVTKYSRRVAQLVLVRREFVTGEGMFIKFIDLDVDALTVLFWDVGVPDSVAFFCEPGCQVTLRWLVLP